MSSDLACYVVQLTSSEGMKCVTSAPIGAPKGFVDDKADWKGRKPCLAISWIILA
jgi:hypothetical protein